MKSSKIDKQDSARVLLTDLLPYETPILFSNEGLHSAVGRKDDMPELVQSILQTKQGNYRIPYTYTIKNGFNKYRNLSVIHPAVQLNFIAFYEKYADMMLYSCSRSPFTLRAPVSVASRFYEKGYGKNDCVVNEAVEEEVEGDVGQAKYASSYFAYKKYNFLYKFYDSYEFIRLEKKFKFLSKIDVSKCFDSIYTHSVSWAVKSKEWAKKNIGRDTFEKNFDELMQKANYNETNGIVIGPEVSRVFAEIIMQQVDLNVLQILDEKGLRVEKDYAVRRYIDDFFIFHDDEKVRDLIVDAFVKELSKYKLYLNDSKTENFDRPFVTNTTIAKTNLKWLCDQKMMPYFEVQRGDESEDDKSCGYRVNTVYQPYKYANLIIRDIKSIVKDHGVKYSDISTYFFSIIRTLFGRIVNSGHVPGVEKDDRNIFRLLLLLLDVTFFVYSMDIKVRSTYVLSQIIVDISSFVARIGGEIEYEIKKKILDEALLIFKSVGSDDADSKIEILNLLIALKELGDDYLFDSDFLEGVFWGNENKGLVKADLAEKLDYFQSVVLLHYISDSASHKSLLEAIYLGFIKKFLGCDKPFLYSEYTCLFFDLISCPYGDSAWKEKLIKGAFKKRGQKRVDPNSISDVASYIQQQQWFISWDKKGDLVRQLRKKELNPPY